jgi:peptide chain release factor 2
MAASPRCGSVSSSCGGIFDAPRLEERVAELDHLSAQPAFWNDQAAANEKLRERAEIKKKLDRLTNASGKLDDALLLRDMGEEADDAMEVERMLGGPHDKSNCFVSINAGAGGTESQDWAEMIMRMITRYCERKGFSVDIADFKPGSEAGISSATIEVSGEYAFGFLKAESGVHRLVRISPFDGQARRQTSFASVGCCPSSTTTSRSSSTTRTSGRGLPLQRRRWPARQQDRLRRAPHYHMPVRGSSSRARPSAASTRTARLAMKLLKSQAVRAREAKRNEERDALYAGKAKIDFGSQIRSYVLQPYQMVKDLRTGWRPATPAPCSTAISAPRPTPPGVSHKGGRIIHRFVHRWPDVGKGTRKSAAPVHMRQKASQVASFRLIPMISCT